MSKKKATDVFKAKIEQYLYLLAERLDGLYGEEDGPSVGEYLDDPGDFPEAEDDNDTNYIHGWIQGAADAYDMTVVELLDEHDIGEKELRAAPRTEPFKAA